MASVNLSLTVFAVLFSGFLILGALGDCEGEGGEGEGEGEGDQGEAEADVSVDVDVTVNVNVCFELCIEGTYASCSGGMRVPACSCACGAPAGQGCVVYSPDGTLMEQCS